MPRKCKDASSRKIAILNSCQHVYQHARSLLVRNEIVQINDGVPFSSNWEATAEINFTATFYLRYISFSDSKASIHAEISRERNRAKKVIAIQHPVFLRNENENWRGQRRLRSSGTTVNTFGWLYIKQPQANIKRHHRTDLNRAITFHFTLHV